MKVTISATHKRRVRKLFNAMGVKIDGRVRTGKRVEYTIATKRAPETIVNAIRNKWAIAVRVGVASC